MPASGTSGAKPSNKENNFMWIPKNKHRPRTTPYVLFSVVFAATGLTLFLLFVKGYLISDT